MELWQGLVRALELLATFDEEVMEIAGLSLVVSIASSAIAACLFIPIACLIHFGRVPAKRWLVAAIQTFYSVPTVLVGLLVFLTFSRRGPLGTLSLMFTPQLMVIGQVILVGPIVLGLVLSALAGIDQKVKQTALSLGASDVQAATLVMREARYAMLTAITMGFGRAISEVGLALMVGGNIRGFTRTLTTAISLETSKGDVELSLALGMILLAIALIVNVIMNRLQQVKIGSTD
jgi:tungstate transport system permease protein